MNWLLIVVVVLWAFYIVRGYKKGMLKMLYSLVSWIVILILVTMATPYMTEFLTANTSIEQNIHKTCKEKLKNLVTGDNAATDADMAPGTEPSSDSSSNSSANSGSDSGSNSSADTGSDSGSNSSANPGSDSGSNSSANSGSDSGSNSSANSGSDSSSNSSADTDSDTSLNSNTDITSKSNKALLDALGLKIPEELLDSIAGDNNLADSFFESTGLYEQAATEITAFAMKGISFILCLIVAVIISRIIYGMISIVEAAPVVGTLNRLLGIIIGSVKGLFIVWTVFAIVAMNAMTQAGMMMSDYIYESPFLQWIYENNFVLTILLRFL